MYTITAEGEHLAGIIIATGGAPGQPAGTSLETNQTFAARIDFYREQIEQVMALPEPRAGWPWGAALLVALARRRARLRIRC